MPDVLVVCMVHNATMLQPAALRLAIARYGSRLSQRHNSARLQPNHGCSRAQNNFPVNCRPMEAQLFWFGCN